MTGPTYTIYHARDWAEGKPTETIQAEIDRCTDKARHHTFQWNEIGNVSDTWTRVDTLTAILETR